MIQIKRDKHGWRMNGSRLGFVVAVAGVLFLIFGPKRLQWPVGGGAIALSWVVSSLVGAKRSGRQLRIRDVVVKALGFVNNFAFIAGIVAWAWDSNVWYKPWLRLAGAFCFVIDLVASEALRRMKVRVDEEKKRRPVGMSWVWSLGLAYAITSPQPHEPQPAWLTLASVVFVVGLIFGAIPVAIVEYRNRRDEREMAIATRSLSFAFIVTMTVVLAFSMLESLKVGPTLRLDYIIAVAAGSWFASWFFLQRRM